MPRKHYTTSDGYESVDILKYSRSHLLAARALFQSDFQFLDSAGYLGHLSLELLLKAGLLHLTTAFPNEHNLEILLSAIVSAPHPIVLSTEDQAALHTFNGFQGVRYPNPRSPANIGTRHYTVLESVWLAVLSQLPPDLLAAFENADPSLKGNRLLMVRPVPATH